LPHVTVFDKSAGTDGIFSREAFTYDHAADVYHCRAVRFSPRPLVNDNATMLYLGQQARLRSMRIEVPMLPQAGFTEGSSLDLSGRSRRAR